SAVPHVTEPANLLVRHNKGTNKKDKARNNQTNRVGSHHSIKGRLRRRHTVSDSDTRRPQDQVPLLNEIRSPRQPITDNTNSIPGNHRTNNRRNHRCPVLEDFPGSLSRIRHRLENARQFLNTTDNRIRNRPHHRRQLLQQGKQRLTNGNLNVILGDLERLTESLSNILTGFSLRRSEFARAVLHYVENVINADFALRCHLLNNVTSGAELRRQSINDRITRLGNHRQRVVHHDTTVVDTLQEAVHGPVKFRRAATGTNDCPTNLVEHLNRVITLNACIGQRLSGLAIRGVINRGGRREFLNLFQRLKRLIAILVQTTHSGLNPLLVDSRTEPANKRGTNRRARSGNTNNSTSLQRPTSSGGHTGTHRPARAISHFRDGFVDRLVKLRGKLACRGENADIGSPKLHGHMYPRLCPT